MRLPGRLWTFSILILCHAKKTETIKKLRWMDKTGNNYLWRNCKWTFCWHMINIVSVAMWQRHDNCAMRLLGLLTNMVNSSFPPDQINIQSGIFKNCLSIDMKVMYSRDFNAHQQRNVLYAENTKHWGDLFHCTNQTSNKSATAWHKSSWNDDTLLDCLLKNFYV